jgi:hypothetical protein
MEKLSLKQLFDKATIKVNKIEEIPLNYLANLLNRYSFAVIRGVINSEKIKKAKEKLKSLYDPNNDNPATGEHPRQIMDNFQKLSIGGAKHSGVYRPRCMRTFYNPIWAEDIYGLKDEFIKAAKVRNLIYGFKVNFAIDKVEDGFWTASRIHSYPSGGGFLISHIDDVVPVVQKASGISNYFQPVIIMSKRGKNDDCDFETGGGFFEVNNIRYYYEDEAKLGDIVIYSGATIHGVEDIDLHKCFDSRQCDGRFAGFVTLYREFTRKKQLNDFVSKQEGKNNLSNSQL